MNAPGRESIGSDYERVTVPSFPSEGSAGGSRKKLKIWKDPKDKALLTTLLAALLIGGVMVVLGARMLIGTDEDKVLMKDYGCIGDDTGNEAMSKEDLIFGTFDRDSFRSVCFTDSIKSAPRDARDVSENGSGKVLAWIDGDTLYIGAKGGVIANADSSRLFAYCENLEEVDFNNCFDTSSAEQMAHLFYRCDNLRKVNFAGADTSGVTTMQRMFVACYSLTEPGVSDLDVSNVRSVYAMFKDCSALQQLDLSKWETDNLSNMERLFEGCSSLSALDLGGWNTSAVTSFKYVFYNCYALSNLDVSSFDTANGTSMYAMFSNCSSLRALNVAGFNTSNVRDMSYMFNNCSGLAVLDVSNFDVSNVSDAKSMFLGCMNVKGYEDWKFSDKELFS